MEAVAEITTEVMNVPALRFPEFEGEWEVKKGNDLFKSSRTKGHEGLPIYSVTLDRGMVSRDSLDRIISNDAKATVSLFVAENDIAYNMMRMWQGAYGLAPVDCMVSPAYVVLRPKPNVSSEFFIEAFARKRSLHLFNAFSYGLTSDRLRLYFKDFAQIKFATPTYFEQQKIASFLSEVNNKIQQLTKKKELLNLYKKGVMQQIFSQQIRFKNENGQDFPDWVEMSLGEILIEHKSRNVNLEIKEVFSVAKEKGVLNQIEHLGRSYASEDISNYKVVYPNDIVYTKSPTSDFPFGIIKQNKTNRTGVVSVLYAVFRPNNMSIGLLLDYYFSSWVNTYNYLNPLVQKGAKNTININNSEFLNGRRISLPKSLEEQTKIGNFLSSLDHKIKLLTLQLTQAKQFKKGLLQQMFV